MRKYLIIFVLCLLATDVSAADKNVPAFRQKGYKGNIGLRLDPTEYDEPHITSSHGYMFNPHIYLGTGASLRMNLAYPGDPFFGLFIDFQYYILNRNSTPTIGVNFGDMEFNFDPDWRHELYAELQAGWSWGIGRGGQYGIRPFLGARCWYQVRRGDSVGPGLYPVAGVVFEF